MDGVDNHTVKISSVRWSHGFLQKEPCFFHNIVTQMSS